MLVVRRRQGESVLIGDDIEVVVLEAGANRVKLGIMARRQVLVFRKELELTREQNCVAATADAQALSRLASALSSLGLPQEAKVKQAANLRAQASES